jgi:hypothetical protein
MSEYLFYLGPERRSGKLAFEWVPFCQGLIDGIAALNFIWKQQLKNIMRSGCSLLTVIGSFV